MLKNFLLTILLMFTLSFAVTMQSVLRSNQYAVLDGTDTVVTNDTAYSTCIYKPLGGVELENLTLYYMCTDSMVIEIQGSFYEDTTSFGWTKIQADSLAADTGRFLVNLIPDSLYYDVFRLSIEAPQDSLLRPEVYIVTRP